MSKIKVVVVDDHKLFREGIIALLSADESIHVTGEASTGQELVPLIEAHHPHVVIIDISLPDMSGLEIIKKYMRKFPDTKFIVLTMHEEGQYIVQSVRFGAYGYLLKNTDGQELVQAIKTVSKGGKYFNQHISELMIKNMAIEGSQDKKLSERETEVLRLVSAGKTTKEIAEALFVSKRTVETHRVNIMKKLHVQNTAEMIHKAATMKLL